jgi:transposase
MNLSSFEQNYCNDELGAAAYSPKVLLKIIMFCYSRGILSSRKIEMACKENIILKALSEDCEPDHSTISAFISTNTEAVKDLFTHVLLQCFDLKLITGEMFAVDGCKLPSNASKEYSGKITDLKKKREKLKKYITKVLFRHQELDKDERAKRIQKPFRKTMGDDKERRQRSIKRLEKKLKRLDKFLEACEPKKGFSGEEVQTNVTDPESARIKSAHGYIQGYNGIAIADSGNQVIVAAEAIGSGAESGIFPKMLEALEENMKRATGKKDPLKNALLEGDTGYFSEENLQEAARRKINVLIPDPQFRQRDPHFAEKKKVKVKKKKYTLEDFRYDEKADCYICPAGKVLEYKCNVTLRNNSGKQYRAKSADCAVCRFIDKCITRRDKTRKAPFRALYIIDRRYENNLSAKMRQKIDDPAYLELYSRRIQIIEPVFSNIRYCKGMDRFTLRTANKVNIQWQLYCIVHNISKCTKSLVEKLGA